MKSLLIVIVASIFTGCAPSDDHIRQIVRQEMGKGMERVVVSAGKVAGPYSPAVRVGNFLFVSGQIGIDQQTGVLRSGGFGHEVRQVMENLGGILRLEGFDSSHVVSANVFLKNMNDYATMNLVYGGYFGEHDYPSRTTVEVSDLPRGANVEIAVIAHRP